MTRTFSVARSSGAWPLSLALGILFTAVVAGCAGELPPELKGGGSGGSGGMDTGGLPPGCPAAAKVFKDHCEVCHSAMAAKDFGGFDMTTAGWQMRLIGMGPPATAPATNVCKSMAGLVYLKPDTQPAQGLFLDKFLATPPCGTQMPQLPPKLTATELTCMQNFANNVVAGGTGQ